jgi:hypothetical protein
VTIARRILKKRHPRSLVLNIHFMSPDEGFGNQTFSASLFEKRHPRLQMPSYRKSCSILIGSCEGPRVELAGLILNFGPAGLIYVAALG